MPTHSRPQPATPLPTRRRGETTAAAGWSSSTRTRRCFSCRTSCPLRTATPSGRRRRHTRRYRPARRAGRGGGPPRRPFGPCAFALHLHRAGCGSSDADGASLCWNVYLLPCVLAVLHRAYPSAASCFLLFRFARAACPRRLLCPAPLPWPTISPQQPQQPAPPYADWRRHRWGLLQLLLIPPHLLNAARDPGGALLGGARRRGYPLGNRQVPRADTGGALLRREMGRPRAASRSGSVLLRARAGAREGAAAAPALPRFPPPAAPLCGLWGPPPVRAARLSPFQSAGGEAAVSCCSLHPSPRASQPQRSHLLVTGATASPSCCRA